MVVDAMHVNSSVGEWTSPIFFTINADKISTKTKTTLPWLRRMYEVETWLRSISWLVQTNNVEEIFLQDSDFINYKVEA